MTKTSGLAEGPPARLRRSDASPPGLGPQTPKLVRGRGGANVGLGLGLGSAVLYLSLIVLLPLGAVVAKAFDGGAGRFWQAVTTPDAWSALTFTLATSVLVAVVNVVMGTVIAWVLVRDRFPGKVVLDTIIDVPFALPTIVAGLVLLSLYGQSSPLHINLAYARSGVFLALLFVTLPFVVRTVQPVLLEFDRDMEQAAHSLGARPWTTFRRIVAPNLAPALLSGGGLAFTRAIAEYGSTVLISGNLPMKTQVAAVVIFGRVESDDISSAAAISTVLLAVSLVMLFGLDLAQRRVSRRG
jgi:sulfate/thiosulfate transport system permease protein